LSTEALAKVDVQVDNLARSYGWQATFHRSPDASYAGCPAKSRCASRSGTKQGGCVHVRCFELRMASH
jgi:hypothetical protein